ncbi:MAG: M28 family peptidase [Candidatus Aegiribacteria sp.]|nr:M28 family peptidase [Candidatus Aegiribacteria sp.]
MNKSSTGSPRKATAKSPESSEYRDKMLEQDTVNLSLPHGRRVGQPGHDIALQYLRRRMGEIGLEYFLDYDYSLPYTALDPTSAQMIEFTNLAGLIHGTNRTAMPVLIGAHYDSAIDAPCSDDNAVSIALLLRVAEILMRKTPRRNVILAFFDAEEAPFFQTENMGSIRFCRDHCRGLDFACVIILDMIGHDFQVGIPLLDMLLPGIRELLFVLGSESHIQLPTIVEQAASCARRLRILPTLNRYIGDMSDHLAFRAGGQPYLLLSKGRGRHSHQPEDGIDWINFSRVRRILDFLLEILRLLDKAPMNRGRKTIDPYELELRMIRRAIGWPLPLMLRYIGLRKRSLQSRRDLDALAGKLSKLIKL